MNDLGFGAMSQADIEHSLVELMGLDAPSQWVPKVCLPSIVRLAHNLRLPSPQLLAGNIVVGSLADADVVLSAHLDEASFVVSDVSADAAKLSELHRFDESMFPAEVRLIGMRGDKATALGTRSLHTLNIEKEDDLDIRLGDRGVYGTGTASSSGSVSGKAIDDRAGAVCAMYGARRLLDLGINVCIVLSDGEQSLPDGYFSRTFPRVLGIIPEKALIVFVDGIFGDGLERGAHGEKALDSALVVPHSADGRGYSLNPTLWSRLRDRWIPEATSRGLRVLASGAYHSRGDDWGMVTNPYYPYEHQAFFVSFGGVGTTPAVRTINTSSLMACVDFIEFIVPRVRGEWL